MEREKSVQGKVRALLAGGLVLGVGAAVTLAEWNDSEFAQVTFEAGSFNLLGSADGSNFNDNPTDQPAALTFAVSPHNLAPGDTVSAPFAVRLDASTTHDAFVTVSTQPSGNLQGLTYQLTRTGGFGCEAAQVGGPLVEPGTPLGAASEAAAFSLAAGEAENPGEAVNLCFEVTAGDIAQGQAGSTTWEFVATSL